MPKPMPAVSTRSLSRRLRIALSAAVLALGACGGGVSTKDPFTPGRILAFGDDLSVILGASNGSGFRAGAKYSLNAVNATDPTVYDCGTYPVWSQTLAANYGMGFPECNPGIEATPRARTFATARATVADVAAQVDAFLAAGGAFQETDLVTMQAGMFDILSAYTAFEGGASADAAVGQVTNAGNALGLLIKRVADAGGKVIFMTVPDLSLSPWAAARDRALVSRMLVAFNTALRVKTPNNGREVGLVEADSRTVTLYSNASTFGFANVTDPVCATGVRDAQLPNCSSSTLVSSVTDGNTYLWADETHIGPHLHADIGSLAYSRARANPF